MPIGQPFANERVFLLDGDDEVTETDHPAEVCVAGTALALGYYNNPEMTEKAFVQNPLNKNWAEGCRLSAGVHTRAPRCM